MQNTYFSFQNKFYEQAEGAPMGSLVSPIMANLYTEQFEREALWSATTPRYVDDTWVIQQQANKHVFLDHINSMDAAIEFTVEGNQDNGRLFPSWIPWSNPRQTIHSLLQSTTSQPTLTSTYSGIAIII